VADRPQTRERAEAAFGDRALFVATDVTVEAHVVAAVAAAVELAPLRLAVLCAGVADQHRLIGSNGTLDIDNLRRVLDVNFVGTVSFLAHAAHAMTDNELKDGDRGVVILVGSIAGLDSASIAYGGSKAAVAGITLAAARELAAEGVRVMCIAPGFFDTGMVASMSETAKRSLSAHPPRAGRPAEFASLVQHIVENPMLNGEVIRLDGAVRLSPAHGK